MDQGPEEIWQHRVQDGVCGVVDAAHRPVIPKVTVRSRSNTHNCLQVKKGSTCD